MTAEVCSDCGWPIGYAFDLQRNQYEPGLCRSPMGSDPDCQPRTIARLRSEIEALRGASAKPCADCGGTGKTTKGLQGWTLPCASCAPPQEQPSAPASSPWVAVESGVMPEVGSVWSAGKFGGEIVWVDETRVDMNHRHHDGSRSVYTFPREWFQLNAAMVEAAPPMDSADGREP